ncbi:iron ABC transporter ATP-binding protein [Ignatzschineria sp. F8392]|uniref:ABC transporter ATP-binding protein n=1 Tax=Ignatzschineria sp. F8392 TaxID=1980117 RepID=UPI000B9873F9|nr:ABC transporter ATP-binding protein [Ignatzschineria sp. F8392]OYQ80587.1 iron ABC transporter ATP-binding protein [Ignatzschineria sp. F8392]
MNLITLENISINYGKRTIIKDLNTAIEEKEIIALLGANGCGKTTLLKSILGLVKPRSGTITIEGKPQSQLKQEEIAKIIGYVPQAQNSHFAFTVEEVVLMGRTAHLHWAATPKEKDRKIAHTALERLGVAHLLKSSITTLSGGERQLVLIARAIAQQPRCLIMDEPTASLDYGNQLRVLEQIKRLKASGITIIMTTHQPEHALSIADRLLLLHQGDLIADGAPETTLTTTNLAQIYNLPESIIEQNFQFEKLQFHSA